MNTAQLAAFHTRTAADTVLGAAAGAFTVGFVIALTDLARFTTPAAFVAALLGAWIVMLVKAGQLDKIAAGGSLDR